VIAVPCLVLVVAGVAKRGWLGTAEAAAGATALFTTALALPVAATYAAFAVYAATRRGRTCRCFGSGTTTAPGAVHVGVDVVLAAVAILGRATAPVILLRTTPLAGVPYAVLAATATAVAVAALTTLPTLAEEW
jgi:hypothetical protein